MNSKWYWLIRQKCRNLKFQIKKAAFRLNERKESSERLSSFSRIVIRTLLVQVAINLVLVAVLYVGDKLLLSAMEILAKTQTDPLIVALPESMISVSPGMMRSPVDASRYRRRRSGAILSLK